MRSLAVPCETIHNNLMKYNFQTHDESKLQQKKYIYIATAAD
jgi:hypothetical protein